MKLDIQKFLFTYSSEKLDSLKVLKETKLPIFIFGEGEYANIVNKFLESNNIKTVCNFTSNNNNLFSNGNNFTFSDEPFIIVLGIADQSKATNLLNSLKSQLNNRATIYYFALNPFYNLSEEVLIQNFDRINLVLDNLDDIESKEILLNYLRSALSFSNEYLNPNLPQYFPQFFRLTNHEIVVDGGAYIGDTLIEYKKIFNTFKEYHAFEPSNNNYLQLATNSNFENIYIYNKGLGLSNEMLLFNDGITESSTSSFLKSTFNQNNLKEVQIVRLDDLINDVSFIKLDIEGAELDALVGSASLISRYKPKIAVCIYHKFEHLWQIQEFLYSIRSDYKFSIRYHSIPKILTELVLYAY